MDTNKIVNNEIQVVEKEKKEGFFIPSKDIVVYTLGGIAMAILYLFCFAEKTLVTKNYDGGFDTMLSYNLSITIFVMMTSLVLFLVLKYTNNIVNKKALLWLIPINIIGLYYTFFSGEVLRSMNIIALIILFAIFTLHITSNNKSYFPKAPFIILQVIGNYYFFARFFIKDERDTESSKAFNRDTVKKILKGIFLAIPLMFLITVILLLSDVIFSEYIIEKLNILSENSKIDFYIIAIFIYIYCTGFIPYSQKLNIKSINYKEKIYDIDTIISGVFLAMINLIFVFFTYVQLKTLTERFLQKIGEDDIYYYYLSSSAREGFFGLLLVTVINFTVMYFFINKFQGFKKKAIRIQLYILCFFTTVLMVSSAYKMYSYINELGFTMLRLAVITFLIMECLLMALTIYKLWKKNNHNYVKSFMIISLVFYVIVNITSSYYVQTALNVAMLKSNKITEIEIKKGELLEGVGIITNLLKDDKYIYSIGKVRLRDEYDDASYNENPYYYIDGYNEKGIWKAWFFKY